MSTAIMEAAERLRLAAERRMPCMPVRDLIGAHDVAAAYAVQELNVRHALATGRVLAGRKIGLTAAAVQKQLGVDQPDFGILFADMQAMETEQIPFGLLMQPKVEAEITLVLKGPLVRDRHTIEDVVAATDHAVASIEIVGSRIANWDIRITDTVADNASSSHFVLGQQKVQVRDLDLVGCRMWTSRAGKEISSGTGGACLGNPLNAAVWLADTMAKVGRPLGAGDVVMTGALGPMVAVAPGDSVLVEIEGLGRVQAQFGKAT
jgi:2-keto-4-pentenoate hydratase